MTRRTETDEERAAAMTAAARAAAPPSIYLPLNVALQARTEAPGELTPARLVPYVRADLAADMAKAAHGPFAMLGAVLAVLVLVAACLAVLWVIFFLAHQLQQFFT